MKLGKIYRLVVESGISKDPRGIDLVREQLSREKGKYEKLGKEEQSYYDRERLTNPYADTRIFYGDPDTEVKSIFVGIDIEVGELVLADRLREKGRRIDAVMTHHPEGTGLANLHELLEMHVEFYARFGVPVRLAESLTHDRQSEIARRMSPLNHYRSVDAARLLDIPFLGVHTPSDNHVTDYLQELVDRRKPRFVEDVVKILREIPEYQQAAKEGTPPYVLLGRESNRAGKICVDMTGGTEGSEEIYTRLSENGVGTVVAMHLAESHFKKAKEARINLVIAGHIVSDSLGLNLLLDRIFASENISVIQGSGFRRVDRRKGKGQIKRRAYAVR